MNQWVTRRSFTVNSTRRLSKKASLVCGLQIHGGPPAEALYKDIRISEFKKKDGRVVVKVATIRVLFHLNDTLA